MAILSFDIMIIPILLALLGLIIVHLFGAQIKFLAGTPRSAWLSAAGGISVTYVFLHLLPELAKGQKAIKEVVSGTLALLDQHAYLIALAGLIAFYGLERLAKESHSEHKADTYEETPDRAIFWLHIASFSIYNVLIGYLLANDFDTLRPLVLLFIAMALHFVVADFALSEQFKKTYHRIGRWLLAGAITLGALIGWFFEIPEVATSALVAVLAGGVILNVLKEELPEERRSRFLPFLGGAAAYAALLLAF